ncbi:GGDEF domain-containing protein [Cryobacterium sp. TMT1-19]|uniref:putative bifunctional diguanylate cyclase/phosphodiesterase n=1 Tax=unclassified Cryobacterium TaxID=2649013 RepID=UPI000CE5623C|nr:MULTISPECIES: sensor domain-containing phosphodiesterase [unclassified Cryobacterium]TFD30368.1 GGDEF domain-containing protein [Cryobacterium sp. TMT1-19]
MDTEPRETANTTISLLLRHVRERGGEGAVIEVLARAGVQQDAKTLQNTSAWVSYATRIRLFEAATAVLGDPNTMFTVGTGAVRGDVQPVLVQLLSVFASPGAIFRQLPRMVPKFTTTSTMDAVRVGQTSATVRYRLHDGYRPSRLDCQYAQGLFSSVPAIFGLALAHISHPQCQSDGYPACEYVLTWSTRVRWWSWRTRSRWVDASLGVLRDKVREVQLAAADLVSSDDVDEVLARIVDRAASAVLAPSYLLIVEPAGGGAPLVRHRGLGDERGADLVARMLRGEQLGERALVVDIASNRRIHGHLAAVFTEGHTAMLGDRALLEAYAGHAAAALDLFTALEESRREGVRTAALLNLAHQLAISDSVEAIAEVIASALAAIVGSDAASVLLWDADLGELRPASAVGFEPADREFFMRTTLTVEQTPELLGVLRRQERVLITADDASPALAELLRAIGSHNVVAVPLLAGDMLMGVATACWVAPVAAEVLAEAITLIEGVSHQGETAMQRARLLETVRHQSQHDALTGLPNRALFALLLDTALAECQPHSRTAVLFCDLDNFKRVNDRLGHRAGDELLRQVAARLRAEVRTNDTIGRLGGDEFAVLVTDLDGEDSAIELAHRVVGCLNPPFHLAGQHVRISASVGVASHSGQGGRGEQLLDAADAGMYDAKRTGRNQIAVARTEVPGSASSNPESPGDTDTSLLVELARAVEANEMRLYYQPVVDISRFGEETVVGAEALIRWAHPRLGVLAPGAFLPLAQERGLITEMDLWVIATACRDVVEWPQLGARPLGVAVNLDAATLLDYRLVSTVRTALNRNDLAPERLTLEVVESRSLVDLPGIVERLVELRRLGIRISLDDFGTGFSTLAWLNTLPVDQIKIDRSFIQDLPNASSVSLVQGILALASKLDVEVIAEGVETTEQLDSLRTSGAVLAQGYLLGRPSATWDPMAGSAVAAARRGA